MLKNLYEIFAEKWYRGGTIWIYSDPHFKDTEMVHLRKNYIGDDEQVKRINKVVGKNDTIIFLGDICDLSFVKKIHGYKVLIMGNHEKGATNYKRVQYKINKEDTCSVEWYEQNKDNIFRVKDEYYFDNHLFDEVYEGPLMVNDRLILSHEPIETLPKYMFNIHGHDHSGWFKSDHHLNMCAEHINYTPVNLIDLIKHGLLKNVDSIHRITIDTATEKKAKRLKKAEEKANEVCDDSNK